MTYKVNIYVLREFVFKCTMENTLPCELCKFKIFEFSEAFVQKFQSLFGTLKYNNAERKRKVNLLLFTSWRQERK